MCPLPRASLQAILQLICHQNLGYPIQWSKLTDTEDNDQGRLCLLDWLQAIISVYEERTNMEELQRKLVTDSWLSWGYVELMVKGRDGVRSESVPEGTNISELYLNSSHSCLTGNNFPPKAYCYYVSVPNDCRWMPPGIACLRFL